MTSCKDIENIILEKKQQIKFEKSRLGISLLRSVEDKENAVEEVTSYAGKELKLKRVRITDTKVLGDHNASDQKEKGEDQTDVLDEISPDLERYIRRYIGLPGMLKAGEYSPNNPLLRGERASGDALLALGEYERRRDTYRKLRQQQYKEYLDQQAKKKQEAKEQTEKDRREKEEKERHRLERDRELEQERLEREKDLERNRIERVVDRSRVEESSKENSMRASLSRLNSYSNRVDVAVQVDSIKCPLSVAVQTDGDYFTLSRCPSKLTEAERELSPRTVRKDEAGRTQATAASDHCPVPLPRKSTRERHYMPSILDGDAIRVRNEKAQKEAVARKQYYQQELKNQILEQQRIKEERIAREKMLEQAEMRRLEEQLRMLKMAQEKEIGKQMHITSVMKENATNFERKRISLNNDLDAIPKALLRRSSQPYDNRYTRDNINTSKSDNLQLPSLFPLYTKQYENNNDKIEPFALNIPETSIFSNSYDVDSYLRKNLNPTNVAINSNFNNLNSNTVDNNNFNNIININDNIEANSDNGCESNVVVEEALIHDRPKSKINNEALYEPSLFRKNTAKESVDTIPIPILMHSPKGLVTNKEVNDSIELSKEMKQVDDKWRVPAVQKNILKSLPSQSGRNVNILTQLGSIRRQLQLEQLKLDETLPK